MADEATTPSKPAAKPQQKPRRRRPQRKFAVNYIVWSMDGSPIPERDMERLDAAMQKAMDESRTRLLGTVVKA